MRRRLKEEEEIGELNIIPYLDIVTNLVLFMLLSMTGLISLGVLDVGTPKIGTPTEAASPSSTPETPALTLTVGISARGFFVAGAGGVLGSAADAPEGVDLARPPTLPQVGGDYDYAGLTALLAQVKEKYPQESRVILVAELDIAYDILVKTMDACRERVVTAASGVIERVPLFKEVWLSSIK